jgi:hypothetical protein
MMKWSFWMPSFSASSFFESEWLMAYTSAPNALAH